MTSYYFNHAGTSYPKPDFVRDSIASAIHSDPLHWGMEFEAAHRTLCEFFNISDLDRLLLTPGCTSALSTAISDLIWKPGDRVLHTQWEHHALHRPLIKLQDQGVVIQAIPCTQNSAVDLRRMEQMLSEQGVKLVAFTAASNVTGEILPIRDMIQLAHKYSALVLLDAAQVVGWLDLDFQDLDADLIAFGSHKGLLAPWGIGGLYIADQVAMQCVAAQCNISSGRETTQRKPRPGYCDVGSVDQLTLAGLSAAVIWLQDQNLEESRITACGHLLHARKILEKFECVQIHKPDNDLEHLPTLAFSIKDMNASEFSNRMLKSEIIVSGGFQCAPLAHQTLGTEEYGVVRISLGILQSFKDVQRLIECLKSELTKISPE